MSIILGDINVGLKKTKMDYGVGYGEKGIKKFVIS